MINMKSHQLPSGTLTELLNMAVYMLAYPSKMVIFHSNVSLPED